MLAELTEAKHLTERALTLLDQIGELRATPHLDLALHELDRALSEEEGKVETRSAIN